MPTAEGLGYGALASRAATMTPPADPPLKSVKNFKLIGKPLKRLDAPDKVNGKAVYGIDDVLGTFCYLCLRAGQT